MSGLCESARALAQRYRICIRRNEHGNLTTFFAAQLGTWDARARAELDEPLAPEVLKERLQPLLVLHGFADEEDLLQLATRVASAGACNLRDALRHLHTELTFSFSDAAQAEAKISGNCSGKKYVVQHVQLKILPSMIGGPSLGIGVEFGVCETPKRPHNYY